MHLYANVPCNCYAKGKSKPFPLPELEKHFYFEEGFWQLDLPFQEYKEEHLTVSKWLNTACEHERMTCYFDSLARWDYLIEFEWALSNVGWDKLPVFYQELQNMHGRGSTSPAEAARLLEDLTFFEKQTGVGRMNFLVDSMTNEGIRAYIAEKGIEYSRCYYSDVLLSFDEDYAFLLHTHTNQEFFRAKSFEIHLLSSLLPRKEPPGLDHRVEYVALDSNQRYKCNSDIRLGFYERGEDEIWRTVRTKVQLHVEARMVDASYFQRITDGFKEACRASITMDCPILWSN